MEEVGKAEEEGHGDTVGEGVCELVALGDKEVVVEEVGEREGAADLDATALPLFVLVGAADAVAHLDTAELALGLRVGVLSEVKEEDTEEDGVEDAVGVSEGEAVVEMDREAVKVERGEAEEVRLMVRVGVKVLMAVEESVEVRQRDRDGLTLPLPHPLPLAVPRTTPPPTPPPLGEMEGVGVLDKLPPTPTPPLPPLPASPPITVGEGLKEGEKDEDPDVEGLGEADLDLPALPLPEAEAHAEEHWVGPCDAVSTTALPEARLLRVWDTLALLEVEGEVEPDLLGEGEGEGVLTLTPPKEAEA